MIFTQSEGTAARRRFHLYLVDATDGLTPETGEAAGQPQISKNGGAWSNTTATLTAIGNGAYYVELTATELNTLGAIAIRYKSANTAEFFGEAKVVLLDTFQSSESTIAATTTTSVWSADRNTFTSGAGRVDFANIGILRRNTLGSGSTTTTVVLDASASATDDFYNGHIVHIYNGTGQDQARYILDYVGSTKTCTVDTMATAPGAGADFEICIMRGPSLTNLPTSGAIADAVWDEAIAGHLTGGSTGAALNGASAPTAAAIADAVWDENVTGHQSSDTFGWHGQYGAGVINQDATAAGSGTSVTLGVTASTTNDTYNGCIIYIYGGTGVGQARFITDYVGATKVATINTAWATNPGGSGAYIILAAANEANPTTTAIADAVWDEARSGHATAGTYGATTEWVSTSAAIADAVWDEALGGHVAAGSTGEKLAEIDTAADINTLLSSVHGTGSWEDAGGLTAAAVADAVWDELMSGHTVSGSFGEGLQTLEDAVLIWPTPVGGGIAASDLITRAMAIADVHDNFVSEAEWLSWLNQEQYALRLFLARSGWALPFDTTVATITSTGWSLVTDGAAAEDIDTNAAGHYIFTPTLADVMAVVAIHESTSSGLRRLDYNDNVSFQKQLPGSTLATGHATAYRLRMYGNELHADFYPTPVAGETYLITYLSAPVALTTTAQAIALPMGWEERIVLGMARRALIKEESDPSQVQRLIAEMDSQIEQLCWNRVMSESPHIRNSDRNTVLDMPSWQSWYWR